MNYLKIILMGWLLTGILTAPNSWSETSMSAAQFEQAQGLKEAAQGNYGRAVELLQRAHQKSPRSDAIQQSLSQVLTEWAQLYFKQKNIPLALQKLQLAVEADTRNGPAWFLRGDIAYLQQSDFKNAVLYWKKALPLAPAAIQRQITVRISRAELDGHLEQGFASVSAAHFEIRFPASVQKQEAVRMANYLEGEYNKFSQELKVSPPKLSVIVYEKQGFDRLTGAHDETLGLYDGRIRISAREVRGPYESIILSHELAHAFLQHAFGNDLPIWIQEGYAQSKEPEKKLTPDQARIENDLKSGVGWIPLKWLDRKFSQPTNLDDVSRSYLEARMAVSYLLRESKGNDYFQKFLEKVSKGDNIKNAFESCFPKMNWNALENGKL